MELVDKFCTLKGVTVFDKYNCTLNQVDIVKNSNKFYILQLLTSGSKYYLWTRYGRVGDKGVFSYKEFDSLPLAKDTFHKQFKTKTGNTFGSPFKKKSGKYMMIELEAPKLTIETKPTSDQTLDPKISLVIKKITNSQMITDTLVNLDLDVTKMPLGKISSSLISQAQDILNHLSGNNLERGEVVEKSSQFWTLVPYATKRNVHPPILEGQAIDQCSELLDTLSHIQVAGTILQKGSSEAEIYQSLGIKLIPLEEGKELKLLKKYIKRTHAPTHNYNLQLVEAYRIDAPKPDGFDKIDNHQLLFHGSRMANFMGILSQGLRIPQGGQVSNGSTLGRGIYFADVVTKSYNYTYSAQTEHTGFMLLCEVALGEPHVVYGCDTSPLNSKYNSRWAKGKTDTDKEGYKDLDGVTVPCGQLVSNPEATNSTFLYNEYVIYNKNQYQFKYLIYLRDE